MSVERTCVWTLRSLLDGEPFDRLISEAGEAFHPFVNMVGEVTFNMPVLIITATRP